MYIRTSLKHCRMTTESMEALQKPGFIGRVRVVAPGCLQSTPCCVFRKEIEDGTPPPTHIRHGTPRNNTRKYSPYTDNVLYFFRSDRVEKHSLQDLHSLSKTHMKISEEFQEFFFCFPKKKAVVIFVFGRRGKRRAKNEKRRAGQRILPMLRKNDTSVKNFKEPKTTLATEEGNR